jgi:hypothetical protein
MVLMGAGLRPHRKCHQQQEQLQESLNTLHDNTMAFY